MKKKLALILAATMMVGALAACGGSPSNADNGGETAQSESASSLKVGVFYYNYADAYISTVRTAMDAELEALGVEFTNFDAQNIQANQTDQINTAITDGYNLLIVNVVENASPDAAQNVVNAAQAQNIPVIFFNRDFDASVIQSYADCAFVGTDPAEAGHMQGKAIGEYLVANYDTVDLNGDGKISYVMFKGQEGNPEAEYRTQYGVEDANAVLEEAGKPALEFYDPNNTQKYLVDQTGAWSELVIANNDNMAEGAISALQSVGYNVEGGDKTIPVYGVDALASAVEKIDAGIMTGSVKQDGEAMAATIASLVTNIQNGEEIMANTDQYNVDSDSAKIRVPYSLYTAEG